jgi:hypothetical protein
MIEKAWFIVHGGKTEVRWWNVRPEAWSLEVVGCVDESGDVRTRIGHFGDANLLNFECTDGVKICKKLKGLDASIYEQSVRDFGKHGLDRLLIN